MGLGKHVVRKIADALRSGLGTDDLPGLDEGFGSAADLFGRISCQLACAKPGRICGEFDEFEMEIGLQV
jgi:hypothetical protein